MKQQVVWAPQPGAQQAYVECPLPFIGFGGARGGGKTDAVLGRFGIRACEDGKRNMVFFRKELPQADDLIERAKEIYMPLGAGYNGMKNQFTFPSGARIRFRPLFNDDDAQKYQGQNLCVAVGTRIRMADGTFKAIKAIQVGDMVATLIGPRRVKATTRPYFAPCVESRVLDRDGNVVGVQRNPIWHPVLTAHGVFSSAAKSEQHTFQTRRIDWQSRQWAISVCSEDRKSLSCEDLTPQAWYAWKEDGRTYCTKSLDDNRARQQLQSLSVPVALHAPTVHLAQKHGRSCHDDASECYAPDRLHEQLSGSSPATQKMCQDCQRLDEPSQHARDQHDTPCGGASCAQTTTQTAEGFQVGCQSCLDSNDARSHQPEETDRDAPPLLSDVVESCHTSSEDASDTIQRHNPEHLQLWVHPYTGAAMDLVEDVVFGKMVMTYVGSQLVTDLTVDEANHYISDCGLINKNTDAAVEEAGNYPDPSPIMKIFGCLRGSKTPNLTLTFNPGGSGHHWLKEMFIKQAPKGMEVLKMKLPTGTQVPYVYIPSRIQDNKRLLEKDPGYIDRLHLVGSPELVRAWLEGDFEIHEGSYFPEFGQRHIVKPFPVPKHWNRYLGYDWGFRSPFCAVWGAVSSGKDDAGNEVPYPKGAIIIYRELWGKQVENTEQARRIAELSGREQVFTAADTAIFNDQGGISIGEQMNKVLLEYKHPPLQPADKDRLSGWSQIRQRLMAKPAMLYFFATCPYLIDSIPSLQYDPRKAEDLDSTGNDHGADAVRYLCKARILEPTYKKEVEPMRGGKIELSQLIKQARRDRRKPKI